MKINRVDTYRDNEIPSIDVFVGVAGDEPRSTYMPDIVYEKRIAQKYYLIKYGSSQVDTCKFGQYGPVEKSDITSNPIWDVVKDIIRMDKDEINILIDYSSMTRSWYANFLTSCFELNVEKTINLFFGYTLADYTSPSTGILYTLEPMYNYQHFKLSTEPTALIIGLGYEKEQAYSLTGYFNVDPVNVYLFRTNKETDERYYKDVTDQNSKLLENVPNEHIFEYSLEDLISMNKTLMDLCSELSSKYRVIIVPCGPKPFTLISLLTSLRNDCVDIWRASNHTDPYYKNKKPSDKIIYTHIRMIPGQTDSLL